MTMLIVRGERGEYLEQHNYETLSHTQTPEETGHVSDDSVISTLSPPLLNAPSFWIPLFASHSTPA